MAPLAGLSVGAPEAPKAAPGTEAANQEDVPSALDSSQGAVPSTSSEQQQITESSSEAPATGEAENMDVAVVDAAQSTVSDAQQDDSHAKIEQDMSQPPHYELEDAMSLQSAVSKLLLMGLPFVAALALIAFVLWRRMQSGVHRFSPVVAHEI